MLHDPRIFTRVHTNINTKRTTNTIKMRTPSIILLSSIFVTLINAQQQPDGAIVPFTSVLPPCASLCGKLFDVQGACTVPAQANTCFCADPRLKPFLDSGTSGVATVCTAASCTDTASLLEIQKWYEGYCNEAVANPSTTVGGSTATGTGAASTGTGTSVSSTPKLAGNQSWFHSHWRWVVMIIVIALAMVIIWVGAVFFKRRYQRKKEREIEMKPPVAWGPHQMQHSTSGYSYGDGTVDVGGRSKEARSMATPAAPAAIATPPDSRGGKNENKGWLRKNKNDG